MYEEITDRSMDKVREAVDDDNMNIDEVINKFDKMHEKIKFKAFGKVTLKSKK